MARAVKYDPGMFLFWLVRVSQVKELNHVLEAEKSCRTDLEMYVAVLNTQKSVLQEDAEKLRKELHEGASPAPREGLAARFLSFLSRAAAPVLIINLWSESFAFL